MCTVSRGKLSTIRDWLCVGQSSNMVLHFVDTERMPKAGTATGSSFEPTCDSYWFSNFLVRCNITAPKANEIPHSYVIC